MSDEIRVEGLEGFEDVPIIEVLVAAGDDVTEGQSLVVLESDKATMELPAPRAGTIASVDVGEGDTVSEGDLLGRLEPTSDGSADGADDAGGATGDGGEEETTRHGDDADATDAQTQGDVSASPGDGAGATNDGAGARDDRAGSTGDGVAEGGRADSDEEAPAGRTGGGRGEDGAGAGGKGEPVDPVGEHARGHDAGGDPTVYASPSVRRLARELDVDLTRVEGTGRKGRIVPEDVRAAKDRPATADGGRGSAPASGGGAPPQPAGGDAGLELLPWPQVDFEKQGEVERRPLARIRKLSAANLHRNWVRIPHVTHHEEADVTELEAFRKQLNAEQGDVKVTMVALLIKASAATLRAFPEVNASLDGDELVLKRFVNVGFAADTPNGLVVPVIKGVDGKGILEVARELTELSGKAREGKLGPGAMSGATFTISSLGGIGGTGFTPIINAPELAILGASRTATRPVWDGEAFVPRLMLPLSLSYDHRVVDGAQAARFCAHLAGVLADLRRVLL